MTASIQAPPSINHQGLNELSRRYMKTLEQIQAHVKHCKRPEGSVRLVAVSKQHSAEAVAEIAKLGQVDFGENYVQESLGKIKSVKGLVNETVGSHTLCWHFVGHIQSRKCRDIAENFQWVHTIDSPKIAKRLDAYRTQNEPLQSLIQVNLQHEVGKSGVDVVQLSDLVGLVATLPNLTLRGLMIIPRPERDFRKQVEVFRRLRELLEQYQGRYSSMAQLSMGMTDDMAAAIGEGATMVRVGTAIFGPRKPVNSRPIK